MRGPQSARIQNPPLQPPGAMTPRCKSEVAWIGTIAFRCGGRVAAVASEVMPG